MNFAELLPQLQAIALDYGLMARSGMDEMLHAFYAILFMPYSSHGMYCGY